MQVSNWDRWQPKYKDRGTPPWIKLYRNLFSNVEWCSLSDGEKGQLISIWILAADKKGYISNDPQVVQKMTMLDAPPNLNKFISLGFLIPACEQPVTSVLTACDSRGDERRVDKIRELPCAPNGARFAEWYEKYPKKKGKSQSLKAWKRKNLDGIADQIIADTVKRVEVEWNDPQFIPMASTYINQERWHDEIETPKPDSEIVRNIPADKLLSFAHERGIPGDGPIGISTDEYRTWLSRKLTERERVTV